MFEVGDKVVHNDYGICQIIGITARRFPGQDRQDYYEMIPLRDDGFGTRFFSAVGLEGKLRKPMSREQILFMIDSMLSADPLRIETTGNRALDMENIRSAYDTLLRSCDPQDWVILLRTIYRKGQLLSARRKRISEFESHTREASERLLYGEIADVMGIPVNEVESFITDRIKNK